MEEYLNKNIKEIINQYPEIEKILDEYNIGCAPCNVGTCLLKDIVEIHNLPPEDEKELMTRIAGIIYPDREIKIPRRKRTSQASREIKYSPPMKKLVDEHVLIKRLVFLIPAVINNIDVDSEEERQLVLDVVDFIRSYADKYHHAKEEEILFKYFDENLDILKVIHEDHENARDHVKTVLEAVNNRDKNTVVNHLNAYKELLTEHIKKEDEILYPWMDRNLSIREVGELFSKFADVDRQFENAPKKYENFVDSLEDKFKLKEMVK